MYETTLNDAMFAPALRAACCLALDSVGKSDGYGLKQCRLINRGLSEIMLSHVTGYSLRLDSHNVTILDAARLLYRTRLSRLRVHVEISSDEEREDGLVTLGTDVHADLDRFMSEAYPALSNVQHLHFASHIKEPSFVSSPRRGLDWLAHQNDHLLGHLCTSMPELATLVVDGPVCLETWRNVGVACLGLNCLDLEPAAHHHPALRQVTALLPRVTSLKFHRETGPGGWFDPLHRAELVAALAVLEQSDVITHLDLGWHSGCMDNRIWARLPPNLQSLVTADIHQSDYDEDPGMYELHAQSPYACLRHVRWNCRIEDATSLFRVAPNLTSFEGSMMFKCSTDSLVFLQWDDYLNTTKAMPELRVLGDLYLLEMGTFHLADFMSKALPSLITTRVRIYAYEVMSSEAMACIPRLFPNIDSLTLVGEFYTDMELPELRRCQHLRHIDLSDNDEISNAGVMLVACMFPVLESISFSTCEELDRDFIECMIGIYGLSVKLMM